MRAQGIESGLSPPAAPFVVQTTIMRPPRMDHDMDARIDNPALTVPGALKALQEMGNAVQQADIPATTLYLVELRASQINGCGICVDIHSRELQLAGEPDERINAVAAWREPRTSPRPSGPPSR